MAGMTERDRELVALGAALGSNCVPCVVYHVGAARNAGITDEELEEAVELADRVRKMPAAQVLKTALVHIGAPSPEAGGADCGC